MTDSHVHSTISFDGYQPIAAFCERAAALGLQHICFCEHIEIGHVYPRDWDGLPDMATYTRAIADARAQYPALRIGMGAEVGLNAGHTAAAAAYVDTLPLDYVIASQHSSPCGRDPYLHPDVYAGRSMDEVAEDFLRHTYHNLLEFSGYDVVGHLSYITMFAPQPQPLLYSRHADVLDELFRLVISRGKGIELNTTGMYIYGTPMPPLSLLGRYRELGGEIVVIGSDAHYTAALGYGYSMARSLLLAVGFRHACTYQNRQPQFFAL